VATRLTYTTGSRSAELDRAFEAALAKAREGEAEPFDREDLSRTVVAQ
jgi:hypothetical protein